MLIRDVLPAGVAGIVIASYFSAIMSTSDSCMMAASGNFLNDIVERFWLKSDKDRESIRYSMLITLIVGILAVLLAVQFTMVLDAVLYAYAFMVAGLFVPTLGAYFWEKSSPTGAIAAMIGGGTTTLLLQLKQVSLPDSIAAIGLDPSFYGLLIASILFVGGSLLFPAQKPELPDSSQSYETEQTA